MCSATSALNESSISALNVSLSFCSICRKSSWMRDCASVESSFDMDIVVCVASEFMLLVFTDLVFVVGEAGERI